MMAAILNSVMLDSDTLFSSLRFTQKHSPSSLTLTQTHLFSLNLMMAAILNYAMLDSDTLLSSLRFTQKDSPSTLTLTQTNLIWLKLIHSHSTWWWQSSWILPCWIQILPSWIQTPSYLLSDSLKNTLPPLWLLTQTNSIWLKLIHSHSTWWWQPSWIPPSWIWLSWIQPS